MTSPTEGRNTIEYLLTRGNLEQVSGATAADSAAIIISRAQRRLLTAESGLGLGDIDGAFAAAYDAYRMAAEALLVRQGLRTTGGEGSHVTLEDAVSSQFARRIREFAKPTFERLRRTRHSVQYFDPSNAEVSADDSKWALSTARSVVDAVRELLSNDPPDLFE
jgi:HEPN domain-containing protein